MSFPTTNAPTEGPGGTRSGSEGPAESETRRSGNATEGSEPAGMRVFDADGLYVGRVRRRDEPGSLSDDLPRVLVHASDEARRELRLETRDVELDATWLAAPERGDHLVLDRPLRDALREEGFEL